MNAFEKRQKQGDDNSSPLSSYEKRIQEQRENALSDMRRYNGSIISSNIETEKREQEQQQIINDDIAAMSSGMVAGSDVDNSIERIREVEEPREDLITLADGRLVPRSLAESDPTIGLRADLGRDTIEIDNQELVQNNTGSFVQPEAVVGQVEPETHYRDTFTHMDVAFMTQTGILGKTFNDIANGIVAFDYHTFNTLRMAYKTAAMPIAKLMYGSDWEQKLNETDAVMQGLNAAVNWGEAEYEYYKSIREYDTQFGQILGGAIEAIPAMLPSIISGNMVPMLQSAFGGSSREAENNNATFGEQIAVAGIKTGIEYITEKLPFDEMQKVIGGNGDLLALVVQPFEEFFGESFAEFAGPLVDRVIYDPDATYTTWNQMVDAGLTGALSSMILMGASGGVQGCQTFIDDMNQGKIDAANLEARTAAAIEDINLRYGLNLDTNPTETEIKNAVQRYLLEQPFAEEQTSVQETEDNAPENGQVNMQDQLDNQSQVEMALDNPADELVNSEQQVDDYNTGDGFAQTVLVNNVDNKAVQEGANGEQVQGIIDGATTANFKHQRGHIRGYNLYKKLTDNEKFMIDIHDSFSEETKAFNKIFNTYYMAGYRGIDMSDFSNFDMLQKSVMNESVLIGHDYIRDQIYQAGQKDAEAEFERNQRIKEQIAAKSEQEQSKASDEVVSENARRYEEAQQQTRKHKIRFYGTTSTIQFSDIIDTSPVPLKHMGPINNAMEQPKGWSKLEKMLDVPELQELGYPGVVYRDGNDVVSADFENGQIKEVKRKRIKDYGNGIDYRFDEREVDSDFEDTSENATKKAELETKIDNIESKLDNLIEVVAKKEGESNVRDNNNNLHQGTQSEVVQGTQSEEEVESDGREDGQQSNGHLPESSRSNEDGQSGNVQSDRGFNEKSADSESTQDGSNRDSKNSTPGRDSSNVARNYVISDAHNIGEGGKVTKYNDNITAIKLLKQILSENRTATAEEQEQLAKYVGWGGIPDAFNLRGKDAKWVTRANELKALLSEEEYEAARKSTMNAHYTSIDVIRGMYNLVEHFGFAQGTIVEPAMGTGNFFGAMPAAMAANSRLHGVELDPLTGAIADLLYPNADIRVQGFEESTYPDNSFDLAIGNVPFADITILSDPKYNKNKFKLHDYFFAKSLDKVKEGGIVLFITSKFTMDKANSRVRKYLDQNANFIGAIRLSSDTFKKNALTQVTTDIIVLQKTGTNIINVHNNMGWFDTVVQDGVKINKYFAENPDMMLGTIDKSLGLRENDYGLRSDGRTIDDVIDKFPANIFDTSSSNITPEIEMPVIGIEDVEYGAYFTDGKVVKQKDIQGNIVPVKGAKKQQLVSDFISLKSALNAVYESQINNESDSALNVAQQTLNDIYDSYVNKHGFVSEKSNARALSTDPAYTLLSALENKVGDEYVKSAIFTKRTIAYSKDITTADTPIDALNVSLNTKARVDTKYMSELLNMDENEVIKQLKGVIYKNPSTKHYETAAEYLSGNVVKKLEIAKSFKRGYEENVKALEKVQPVKLKATEIEISLGATWVPMDVYEGFVRKLFNIPRWADVNLNYNPVNAEYVLYTSDGIKTAAARDKYSVKNDHGKIQMNGIELLKRALNNKNPEITKTVGDKKVVDIVAVEKAKLVIEEMNEAFKDYVYKTKDVRNKVTDIYNYKFNNTVNRVYSSEHMTFPNMNPAITLRDHQSNAVARMLQDNTLLVHPVGAGKTFEMIVAAMEMKRLGIANKPMLVVPNNKAADFLQDTLLLYPQAKVLMLTEDEMSAKNRKSMTARVANSEYDLVIIRKSSFEKIPVSKKTQQASIKEEIKQVEAAIISGSEEMDNRMIKQLEKTKDKLSQRLKDLNNKPKDNVVTFEQIGVDALFVDEAHNYKNLFTYTKQQRVAGISTSHADVSSDMYMKTQYMNKVGSRVVFATATPISNSMTEMYTMFRYLRPDLLAEMDMSVFDAWAGTFGKIVTIPEISATTGKFTQKTRFSQFVNIPELVNAFSQFADIVQKEDLNLRLPKLKTGKMQLVEIERSDSLGKYQELLAERAAAVKSGSVDPSEDNYLQITNDGKMAALDIRFVLNQFEDIDKPDVDAMIQESKLYKCADRVERIYKSTTKSKGTQLIFLDRGIPNSDSKRYDFMMYQALKDELISRGIPSNQIEFIQDHDSTERKQDLFDKVRQGTVRVLIGSTAKMGEGVNVQDRTAALHHLDVPWRPSDIEQRNGRVIRQGNIFDEVEIFVYATKGSFDAVSWQTVQRKAQFIGQVLSNNAGRNSEDIDETAMSFAEISAITSDNPLILEKYNLDNEIKSMQIKKKRHLQNQYEAEEMLSLLPAEKERVGKRVEKLKADKKAAISTKGDKFTMTVEGKTFKERKKAGAAIIELANKIKYSEINVGDFAGFTVTASKDNMYTQMFKLHINGDGRYSITITPKTEPLSVIRQLENVISSFDKKITEMNTRQTAIDESIENFESIKGEVFADEEVLKVKQQRQAELVELLSDDTKKKDEVPPQFKGHEATTENDMFEIMKDEGGFLNFNGKPVPNEERLTYEDKDLEYQHMDARLTPDTIVDKVKEWARNFGKMSTRAFKELDPALAKNSVAIQQLVKYPQLKSLAGDETTRILFDILRHDKAELTQEEFNRFERLVLLLDLHEEAIAGHTLPGIWTPESVQYELERVQKSISDNVKAAIRRRNQYWDTIKENYISEMEKLGFNVKDRFQRKNYFRHMVLEYANSKVKGSGSRVKVNDKRGFTKLRHGSNKLINQDYLQAEYEVMAHMIYDTKVAEMLLTIQDSYDIKNDLKKAAKEYNQGVKAKNKAALEEKLTRLSMEGAPEYYDLYNTYRRNIALGFKTLKGLAEAGELENNFGIFEKEVDALKYGYDSEGMMDYFSWLADNAEDEAVKGVLTVFKYQKKLREFTEEILGDQYIDPDARWDDAIPEGYRLWQPIQGKHFYTANAISDEFATALATGDISDLKAYQTKVREVVAIGTDKNQFVLPEEVANSLDNVYQKINDESDPMHKFAMAPLKLWKSWVLTGNPKQVVKYNIRNLSGDLDGVISAAGFKAMNPKYINKAVKDLYAAMKHMKFSADLLEWRDRGGFQSLLYAQEIADINNMKQFRNFKHIDNQTLLDKMKRRVPMLGTYSDFTRNLTDYRESILRYSTYLFYKEYLAANNGTPDFYGASLPSRIDGLKTNEDKAYQLSKDALGAYDEITETGKALRKYLIPFYSWTEVNMKRYFRIFRNTISDVKQQTETGKKYEKVMGLAGKLTLKGTRALGRTMIRVSFLAALLQAWNRLIMRDEDDKLPEGIRNTPHITLGTNGKGEIIYFSRLGALNDVLEWFGLDQLPSDIEDLLSGRKTIGEQSKEMVLAPVNKVINSFTPYLKMPVELLSGQTYFPDFSEPRRIRDNGYYVAQSLGLKDEYSALAGLPMDTPYLQTWAKAFIYKSDPETSAYYKAIDLRYKFEEQVLHQEGYNGYSSSEKSKALYYYKLALKYGDHKGAEKYLALYAKYGGTVRGLEQSLSYLDPLYGLDEQEQQMFYMWLTTEEREQVHMALEYYYSLLNQE